MPHLSLANAAVAAKRITHDQYNKLGIRLRTQLGRCFILAGTAQLAFGHDWEEALSNLLQAEVVKFVNRHNLDVPETAAFDDVSRMYLENPEWLKQQYPQKNDRRGAALVDKVEHVPLMTQARALEIHKELKQEGFYPDETIDPGAAGTGTGR